MRVFPSSLILLLWTATAFPLSVTSVTGASSFTTTGTPTAFGGLAGNDCSGAAANANSTCDSCETSQLVCTTTPLCACNSARIYPSLILTINLKKNESNSNNAILLTTDTTTGTSVPLTTTNNSGNSVSVRWSEICSRVSGFTATCTTAAVTSPSNSTTMKIVIDKDGNGAVSNGEETVDVSFKLLAPDSTSYSVQGASNEGFDTFLAYPGDEKIYLEELNAIGGFPILGYGGKALQVRVYMSDTSMADAAPGRPGLSPEDLPIIEDGATLKNNIVDGLTNGTAYAFRIGIVDDANNVVLFFPPNPVGSGTSCDSTPLDGSNCRYIASPDEVRGLLNDDFNCFIATASYGSSFEPRLVLLRQFRNKVLLRYQWGVEAVKRYYEYGPIGARFIHQHEWIKPVVRVLLWPAIGFSWLALKVGLVPTLLLSLLGFATLLIPAGMWVRRRVASA